MMTCTTIHAQMQHQVDKLFSQGLSPRRHTRLRDHLRDCDRCRSHYERVRRLEDVLFDTAGGINPAAMDRLSSLVMTSTAEPAPGSWSIATRLLSGAVAVTAVALVSVAVWPSLSTDSIGRSDAADGALVARGLGAAPSQAGLSAFRIDPQTHAVSRLSRQDAAVAAAAVHDGDILQLAYSNTGLSHATVVGIDAQGQLQWYHPKVTNQQNGGVLLRRDVVDQPFGQAWTVTAPPGPLRLFAIFSDGPISKTAVEVAVDALHQRGASITNGVKLPGIGVSQDSLLIEVRK